MSDQTATLRQRLRDTAYEAMLDSAERVMIQKGYEKATMQEIAAAAGCATGTFYGYFKNKEELLQGIVGRHFRALAAMMRQAAADCQTPLEKLYRHMRVAVEYFNRERDFFRLFFAAIPRRADAVEHLLRQSAQDDHTAFHEYTLHIIREAQSRGEVRSDFPAEGILKFMHGLSLAAFEQFSVESPPRDSEEQLRVLWGFMTGGIGACGKGPGHD